MKRALVIDDEASIRLAVRYVLEDGGYSVEEAVDGRQGLRCIQQNQHPGVVLLDLMMPYLSGTEVLTILFADPQPLAHQRILLMSAVNPYKLAPALRQAMQHHQVRFLAKPFDIDVLSGTVDALYHEAIQATSQRLSYTTPLVDEWEVVLHEIAQDAAAHQPFPHRTNAQ